MIIDIICKKISLCRVLCYVGHLNNYSVSLVSFSFHSVSLILGLEKLFWSRSCPHTSGLVLVLFSQHSGLVNIPGMWLHTHWLIFEFVAEMCAVHDVCCVYRISVCLLKNDRMIGLWSFCSRLSSYSEFLFWFLLCAVCCFNSSFDYNWKWSVIIIVIVIIYSPEIKYMYTMTQKNLQLARHTRLNSTYDSLNYAYIT